MKTLTQRFISCSTKVYSDHYLIINLGSTVQDTQFQNEPYLFLRLLIRRSRYLTFTRLRRSTDLTGLLIKAPLSSFDQFRLFVDDVYDLCLINAAKKANYFCKSLWRNLNHPTEFFFWSVDRISKFQNHLLHCWIVTVPAATKLDSKEKNWRKHNCLLVIFKDFSKIQRSFSSVSKYAGASFCIIKFQKIFTINNSITVNRYPRMSSSLTKKKLIDFYFLLDFSHSD